MSRKKGKSSKGKAKVHTSKPTPPGRSQAPTQQARGTRPQHESTVSSFSLFDEARWMSNHRTTAYDTGKKLRHLPIQFVSAGLLLGTIKDIPKAVELAEPIVPQKEKPAQLSVMGDVQVDTLDEGQDNSKAMAHMALDSPSSPTSDISSDTDEVIFAGRQPNAETVTSTRAVSPMVEPSKKHDQQSIPTVSDIQQVPTPAVASAEIQTTLDSPKDRSSLSEEFASDSIVEDHFHLRRGDKPSWEGKTTAWVHRSKPGVGWLPSDVRSSTNSSRGRPEEARDLAIDDYIQNLLEGDPDLASTASRSFALREMSLERGSHNDWEPASDDERNHGPSKSKDESVVGEDDSWSSDMLGDFDDLSTSSDVIDTVSRIVSKRTRNDILQYLCIYEGSVMDDARWLPASFLGRSQEKDLIKEFEQKMIVRARRQISADEISSDDSVSDEDIDAEDDEEEESNDEIDDEAFARMLQKQEDLGLGSDDIMLFDDDISPVFHDSHFAAFAQRGNISRKTRVKAGRKTAHSFPSASAMVDALEMDPYGAFDIMDTERPSLKVKKKGRRGNLPPELDDPDLNERLQAAWENDRSKKRMKKAEREQLRQQGLLGRKGKAADLKMKYKDGFDANDIVDEIRVFLASEQQTLSLPPMDASRRATVHQASSWLNLKSRSRGDGNDRFTVLSKTSLTRTWSEDDFDALLQKKGFFKRLQSASQMKRDGRKAQGGLRQRPQIGYKDGDAVGANAPELGPENIGHALLKKMGWSKGMGLGAVDNKGILQPISHIVKTNKAGLQ